MAAREKVDTRDVEDGHWTNGVGNRAEVSGGGFEESETSVSAGVDVAIAELAARQRGLVTRSQLLALGLGPSGISHRVARKRLHRVYRSVYLVGHPVPVPLAIEHAALLACGGGAVLSHASAAALWGMQKTTPPKVEVTVIGRRSRIEGIEIHHARELPRMLIRRRRGLPLTSPARTLLDLAPSADARSLERAAAEARALGLLEKGELERIVFLSSGRRGIEAVRRLLTRDSRPALTRSEAEERLLTLIRKARLPEPECNVRIAGHEVDFLWRPSNVVVEVDGYAFHSSRTAFERDRLRDADLQAAGLTVVRLTWRRIVNEPEAVVAQIARVL